jgi:hypothetical protein
MEQRTTDGTKNGTNWNNGAIDNGTTWNNRSNGTMEQRTIDSGTATRTGNEQ